MNLFEIGDRDGGGDGSMINGKCKSAQRDSYDAGDLCVKSNLYCVLLDPYLLQGFNIKGCMCASLSLCLHLLECLLLGAFFLSLLPSSPCFIHCLNHHTLLLIPFHSCFSFSSSLDHIESA